jgi:alkylation response protein AidB-like acyl-CoA dehydrogenase
MTEARAAEEVSPRVLEFVSWLTEHLHEHERNSRFSPEFVTRAAWAGLLSKIAATPDSIRSYSRGLIQVAAAHPSAAFVIHQHQVAHQFCAASGLSHVGDGMALICNANSEPGMHFRGTAVRHRSLQTIGSIALLTGIKHFCSGIEIASHFLSLVGTETGDTTLVLVPTSRRGVNVEGAWTASGLRATGSRSLRLNSVEVGADERVAIDTRLLPRRWWAYGYGLIAYGAGERMRQLLVDAIVTSPEPTSGVEELTLGSCDIDAHAARSSLLRMPELLSDQDPDDSQADGETAAARVLAQRFADAVCSRARPIVGGALVDEASIWNLLQRDIAAVGIVPPSQERVERFLGQRDLGLETVLLSTRVGEAP